MALTKGKSSGLSVSAKNGVLFSGIPVEDLVKRYDSPVFVFSEARIIENYKALSSAFRKYYPKTEVYYSMKTNYEPQILSTLRSQGSKAELASGMELAFAKKAGFSGPDLVLDGPGWTSEDIDLCIKEGVHILNVDSLDMLYLVDKIAGKNKQKVKIGFRIYPEIHISMLKTFIENYISKFGVPISDAVEAFRIAQELKNVEPVGIHTHIGSMITDPSYYEKTVDKFIKLASDLKKKLGIKLEEINLGGGYGVQSINYFSIQNIILNKVGVSQYSKAASIEEFGRRIATRFKDNLAKYKLADITLVLEPGRFIVSDSGVLITQVISAKKGWIFLDGGANIIPESIFFIRRGFIVANKYHQKPTHKYGIAGNTLSTPDILAIDQKMPKMEVGDTVIVLDAGAYTISRSNQFTVLRPEVVYVTKDGKLKHMRKKEVVLDLLNKLLL